MFVVVFVV